MNPSAAVRKDRNGHLENQSYQKRPFWRFWFGESPFWVLMTGSVNILINNLFETPPYILFRICQDLEVPKKSAKHFIFLPIKNRIPSILIQILSMSLVLLTGPNLVDPIHWTGFVLLVLIIHIMSNSTRSPGIHGQSELTRKSERSMKPGLKGFANVVGKLVGIVCKRMGLWTSIIDRTTELGLENFWTWLSHEVKLSIDRHES